MYCIIDIQGYSGLHGHQELTPKEVAIHDSDRNEYVFHIKSDHPFVFLSKKQKNIVHWTILYYNALSYSGGVITERNFLRELRKISEKCDTIITNSVQKQTYLKSVLDREIVLFNEGGMYGVRPYVPDNCNRHYKKDVRCAVIGAKLQSRFYDEHLRRLASSAKAESDEQQQISSGSVCERPDSPPDQTPCGDNSQLG